MITNQVKESREKLMVFKREVANRKSSVQNVRKLLALPPSSPKKENKQLEFKYISDAPHSGVKSSAIGSVFFDSYILENPVMFLFSSEPKVMTTMIFYD